LDGVEVRHVAAPGAQGGVVGTGQRDRVPGTPRKECRLNRPIRLTLSGTGVDRLPSQQIENGDELHRGRTYPLPAMGASSGGDLWRRGPVVRYPRRTGRGPCPME